MATIYSVPEEVIVRNFAGQSSEKLLTRRLLIRSTFSSRVTVHVLAPTTPSFRLSTSSGDVVSGTQSFEISSETALSFRVQFIPPGNGDSTHCLDLIACTWASDGVWKTWLKAIHNDEQEPPSDLFNPSAESLEFAVLETVAALFPHAEPPSSLPDEDSHPAAPTGEASDDRQDDTASALDAAGDRSDSPAQSHEHPEADHLDDMSVRSYSSAGHPEASDTASTITDAAQRPTRVRSKWGPPVAPRRHRRTGYAKPVNDETAVASPVAAAARRAAQSSDLAEHYKQPRHIPVAKEGPKAGKAAPPVQARDDDSSDGDEDGPTPLTGPPRQTEEEMQFYKQLMTLPPPPPRSSAPTVGSQSTPKSPPAEAPEAGVDTPIDDATFLDNVRRFVVGSGESALFMLRDGCYDSRGCQVARPPLGPSRAPSSTSTSMSDSGSASTAALSTTYSEVSTLPAPRPQRTVQPRNSTQDKTQSVQGRGRRLSSKKDPSSDAHDEIFQRNWDAL